MSMCFALVFLFCLINPHDISILKNEFNQIEQNKMKDSHLKNSIMSTLHPICHQQSLKDSLEDNCVNFKSFEMSC